MKIDEWFVEVGEADWWRRTSLIRAVQSCLIDVETEEWMERRLGGLRYVKDVEVRGWGLVGFWSQVLGPARRPLSSSSSDVVSPEEEEEEEEEEDEDEDEDEVVVSMSEDDEVSMDDPESDSAGGGESVLDDALDRGSSGDDGGDISIGSASG